MNAPNTLPLYILMFVAGLGIPVMAAMNANIGSRLGSPVMAVFILATLAALLSGAIVVFAAQQPIISAFGTVPKPYYGAGLLFLFYILCITYAAPRIGIGNAVFLVLLGQIVAAAMIDQFALFGAVQVRLTSTRILGILLMVIGVYLARRQIVEL
jgi:bacterial/archaeal transporter family-2 protein